MVSVTAARRGIPELTGASQVLHAEGQASQLPNCCHNMGIISGRHHPDLLNEKAVSVLDFVVNAQLCEGEIGGLPPRNHHQSQASFVWFASEGGTGLFTKHCQCPALHL